MKTLFERLKPEVVEELNGQIDQFPYVTNFIYDDLKSNTFIFDIKYNTVLHLGSFYFKNINVGYFAIANLFEDDME